MLRIPNFNDEMAIASVNEEGKWTFPVTGRIEFMARCRVGKY